MYAYLMEKFKMNDNLKLNVLLKLQTQRLILSLTKFFNLESNNSEQFLLQMTFLLITENTLQNSFMYMNQNLSDWFSKFFNYVSP
jgi:hypothetical protein